MLPAFILPASSLANQPASELASYSYQPASQNRNKQRKKGGEEEEEAEGSFARLPLFSCKKPVANILLRVP